jgi:hypothetical protein
MKSARIATLSLTLALWATTGTTGWAGLVITHASIIPAPLPIPIGGFVNPQSFLLNLKFVKFYVINITIPNDSITIYDDDSPFPPQSLGTFAGLRTWIARGEIALRTPTRKPGGGTR